MTSMLLVPMGCSWACSGFPKTSFRPATQVAKGAVTRTVAYHEAYHHAEAAFATPAERAPLGALPFESLVLALGQFVGFCR
jgi:hypothetical protein